MQTVTKISEMLTEVRSRDYLNPAKFLFISDVHFDNPKCDRDMLFRHLDKAGEEGALVFCFGDFFDVMASKNDRRRSKSLLRPEYVSGNYIQDVVMDTAEKLKPYAHLFALISDGNHETAILKNQEVDINKWLCYELKREGSPVVHGGYHGFVRFAWNAKDGGRVRSYVLYYHHGLWGGTITKGTLSVVRFASIVPQADCIISGHVHEKWKVVHQRYHLKQNGQVETRPQVHLKTATYKEEYAKPGGWAVEKIGMPKPLGGWWAEMMPGSKSGVDARYWEAV